MIDYTLILIKKYQGSVWTLDGDDYSGLTWLSDTPKPSKSTLDGLWDEVQELIAAEAEAKAQAKSALLERLGLTQEEFNILTAQS
jgi:hypothetical protein